MPLIIDNKHRKVIADTVGTSKNKDETNGAWYSQYNCIANSNIKGKVGISKKDTMNSAESSKASDWSNKSDIESKTAKKDKNMPKFDLKEMADLMDYARIISKNELPKWRKDLIKENGSTGTKKPGYTDVSKLFLMKWDQKELGRLYFDSTRTIYFDGTKFMMRTSGNPDADRIKSVPISLESWLIEVMRDRDSKLLKDRKWRYRNMWHELIRELQVNK